MKSESGEKASIFARAGDYWTIAHGGRAFRLRDSKGLRYLAELLHNPGREFHVLELSAIVGAGDEAAPVDLGDSGMLLDAQAKAAYRRRLEDLGRELEEAERFHDPGRAARARAEIEALTAELSRATGLGGRDRRAGSPAERARSRITMAIKGTLRKIAENDAELGRHLGKTVKTGRFCSYAPDSREPRWAARGAKDVAQVTGPPVEAPEPPADEIRRNRPALEGERKHVTVLFCAIEDSAGLTERMDPEQWRAVVERFSRLVVEAVEGYEGTVSQHAGDRVTALFGAPLAQEDHAQRACHAALRIREAVASRASERRAAHELELAVRMGMSSGEVVVGRIGNDLRMDYTALGHTTHVAERMERIAPRGTICLAETTARLVRDFFELVARGDHVVEGAARRTGVFELLAAGKASTALQAAERRGFSRFVGRDAELRVLDGALVRAIEGEGSVLGVVGEAGIGKSRLCREFLREVRERDTRVYEGHCPPHGKTVPFIPVLELLRSYFGIEERDSASGARGKIASTVSPLDESLRDALPLLFEFLAVSDPDAPAPLMDPQAKQRWLYDLLRTIVRERGRLEPAVILVDDLHWIDAASDALLAELVEAVEGTRTLFLVNFRPEYAAPWMRKSSYQQLALKPLAGSAIDALVTSLVGRDPSTAGLDVLIRERTGGNPFFIEETVAELVESGTLEGSRGARRLVRPLDASSLPARVQAVLAGRIDRLDGREKETLQAASVFGRSFAVRALVEVTGLEEPVLHASLNVLRDKGFVREERRFPEPEYVFKHPLTREVAYRSQLERRRRGVHEAVARAIEKLHPEKLGERAALVAHHWEAAGDALAAARWHRRAADWAGASAPLEALRHWKKVRELASAAPESDESLELGILAAGGILDCGWRTDAVSAEEAESLFAELIAVARRRGDSRSLVVLHCATATFLSATGDPRRGLEHATEAVRIGAGSGEIDLRLAAWSELSYALYASGRIREAYELNGRALRDPPDDPRVGAEIRVYAPLLQIRNNQGLCSIYHADLETAERLLIETAALAREHRGDVEFVPITSYLRAEVAAFRGDGDAAVALAGEAFEATERIGVTLLRVHVRVFAGRAHLARGDWGDALRVADEGLRIAREGRGGLDHEAALLAILAEAELGLGDRERARATAIEAIAVAERRGTLLQELFARLALVRTLLAHADAGNVEVLAEELERSKRLVEETGASTLEPLVAVELARLAGLRGDEATRRFELGEAHRRFLEIGAVRRADEVAEELARWPREARVSR